MKASQLIRDLANNIATYHDLDVLFKIGDEKYDSAEIICGLQKICDGKMIIDVFKSMKE